MIVREHIIELLNERDMTTTEVAVAVNRSVESTRSTLWRLSVLGKIRQTRKGIMGRGGCPATWGKVLAKGKREG